MRSIDCTPFKNIKSRLQAEHGPSLDWLPITALVIDPAYQREITSQGRKNVLRIAEAFDWRYFSAVIVSPVPGGRFAIIDGQHRTTAAALCGIETVPCQIIHASPGEQAVAFSAINGTVTKVSRQAQFKAALAANDARALRIDQLAQAVGLNILRYPVAQGTSMARPNQTMAVGTILRIAEQHDDAFMTMLFRLLVASAGEELGQITAMTIRHYEMALDDHPAWLLTPSALIDAFEQILPSDIHAAALADRVKYPKATIEDLHQARLIEAVQSKIARPAS